jgi:hypothetical protein
MQPEGVQPASVTFLGVLLNACASVIALEEGMCVYHHIVQIGLESDVFEGTSLVDMYAKNVEALRMLGESSTRCHLKLWSLGLP